MLSLSRCAPKIFLLETSSIEEIERYLIEGLNGKKCDFETAFADSDENCIIVFLLDKLNKIVKFKDPKSIILLSKRSDSFFIDLINSKRCSLISNMRLAPVMIIMRTFGDAKKIVDKIKNEYNGEEGLTTDLWQEHNNGTLITFTQTPINRVMSFDDLYETALLVNKDYNYILEQFRIRGLEFLNAGIDNKDWYELEIKIYDRYSQYKLHYERLLKVLEGLELGLILGESWGKDAALFFLNVDVYRVRLFTFYEPEYIKKVLLGLEHLDNGRRIVDYDLFYKRKKIHWSEIKDRGRDDRYLYSTKLRKKILSELSEVRVKEILELEDKILETQY